MVPILTARRGGATAVTPLKIARFRVTIGQRAKSEKINKYLFAPFCELPPIWLKKGWKEKGEASPPNFIATLLESGEPRLSHYFATPKRDFTYGFFHVHNEDTIRMQERRNYETRPVWHPSLASRQWQSRQLPHSLSK